MRFTYEGEGDTLFGSVRPVPATESDPVADDFFLLRAEGTHEVVGIECLDFSRHVQDAAWLASLPTDPLFEDAEGARTYTARETVERAWLKIRARASGTVQEPLVMVSPRV